MLLSENNYYIILYIIERGYYGPFYMIISYNFYNYSCNNNNNNNNRVC